MNIESSHVVRKMQATDLEMVLHWRNHDQVRQYMFNPAKIELSEHALWFQKASEDKSRHLLIYEENKEPMGFAHLHQLNEGGVMDWGFYKNPDAPKGVGISLGKTVLDYAFVKAGAYKICGDVIATNAASVIFHTRLGFVREGELRDQHFDGLSYQNVVSFGLLKKEWLQRALMPQELA